MKGPISLSNLGVYGLAMLAIIGLVSQFIPKDTLNFEVVVLGIAPLGTILLALAAAIGAKITGKPQEPSAPAPKPEKDGTTLKSSGYALSIALALLLAVSVSACSPRSAGDGGPAAKSGLDVGRVVGAVCRNALAGLEIAQARPSEDESRAYKLSIAEALVRANCPAAQWPSGL